MGVSSLADIFVSKSHCMMGNICFISRRCWHQTERGNLPNKPRHKLLSTSDMRIQSLSKLSSSSRQCVLGFVFIFQTVWFNIWIIPKPICLSASGT